MRPRVRPVLLVLGFMIGLGSVLLVQQYAPFVAAGVALILGFVLPTVIPHRRKPAASAPPAAGAPYPPPPAYQPPYPPPGYQPYPPGYQPYQPGGSADQGVGQAPPIGPQHE